MSQGSQSLSNLGRDRHSSSGHDIFKPPGDASVDPRVTEMEDAYVEESHRLAFSKLSLQDTDLPNRPNYGKNGAPVILRTNHFKVQLDESQQLFLYRADVDKRMRDSKLQLRDFFQTLIRTLPELQPGMIGDALASDYVSLLVTSKKIDLGPTDKKTFRISYYDREGGQVKAKGESFTFTLSLLQSMSFAKFVQHVTSNENESMDRHVVQALNAIIAGRPRTTRGVYPGAPNTFFQFPDRITANNFNLEGGLIAIRGYCHSAHLGTARVLLNVHGQCNPFYKPINVCELMQEFENLVGGEYYLPQGFLSKLRVKTSYMRDSNGNPAIKIKTVIGVSPENADRTMFKLKDNRSETVISVAQYFSTKYHIKLKYPGKRVLNCGSTIDPIWIPAELCSALPGQRYFGDLHKDQTTKMLNIAARPPAENARRIVAADGGLGLIGVVPERFKTLAAFGVNVDPNMVVVQGRVLDPPRLKYAGSTGAPRGGSWNLSGKKFTNSSRMSSWNWLRIGSAAAIDSKKLTPSSKAMISVFTKQVLKGMVAKDCAGPIVNLPAAANRVPIELRSTVDKALENVFKDQKEKGISMLIVVLTSDDSWLYNRVKFWGDVRCGIHTQCVQLSKMLRGDMSYLANVSLKVNLKLRGMNQGLQSSDLGFLGRGHTMVVGIDVTHPKPGSVKETPSIAGVVASVDADFAQWPGNICCQESRKEMVSKLDVLVEERLSLWVSRNKGKSLENILVYRDGVADSQYETVLQQEVPAIRRACEKILGQVPQPKIALIVAVKRHHTRFYPTDAKGADEKHKNNIKNGTVVDRGITMPKKWDFFMAAHVALNGTTIPAHYVVLLDEIKDNKKLGVDQLEMITHNLCYLHGTSTKAISICPPAYYADKICERGRCYLDDYLTSQKAAGKHFDYNETPWRMGVHESIKDSMFYV